MKTILVSGASGFIGRHCLPLLLEKGFEVHALARRPPATQAVTEVTWHKADLLLPGRPTELIRSIEPDYLLHFAWHTVPGEYWHAPANIEWVRATIELLSAFAAGQGQRVVLAGTCAEYQRDAGECREAGTPLLPDTLYGTCKHALESILQSSSGQTTLSYAWGRVFFPYGPFEHSSRVVAYAVQTLLRGEPALCSSGKQILDFIYVKDVAAAFVSLLESNLQGAVNIGSGRATPLSDVLQEIGAQIERPELIKLDAIRDGSSIRRLWANAERLAKDVPWTPSYDLSRGIRETIEWWRNAQRASDVPAQPLRP